METGEKIPSYDEMLAMNVDDLRKWVLLRSQREHRDKLIQEMMRHEEVTHSFQKTAKDPAIEGEHVALNVFDSEKSAGAVEWLDKLGELSGSGEDFVREVIFAKAASDHVHLGTHIEFRKFKESD